MHNLICKVYFEHNILIINFIPPSSSSSSHPCPHVYTHRSGLIRVQSEIMFLYTHFNFNHRPWPVALFPRGLFSHPYLPLQWVCISAPIISVIMIPLCVYPSLCILSTSLSLSLHWQTVSCLPWLHCLPARKCKETRKTSFKCVRISWCMLGYFPFLCTCSIWSGFSQTRATRIGSRMHAVSGQAAWSRKYSWSFSRIRSLDLTGAWWISISPYWSEQSYSRTSLRL